MADISFNPQNPTTTFNPSTTLLGSQGNIPGNSDVSYNLLRATDNLANDVSASYVVAGAQYVFEATGGYWNAQTFADITVEKQTKITTFDVTGAVEVLLPASYFNNVIGVNTLYNGTSGKGWNDASMCFMVDSVTMPALDFKAQCSVANIVSVGKLASLYSDFSKYVLTYFNITSSATGGAAAGASETGFATLFSGDYNFNPNGGMFTTTDFYNLINAADTHLSPVDGSFNSGLGGSIQIDNITSLLRNAVSSNPFSNNRPLDSSSNGVSAGFLPKDLIFIGSSGISITLQLVLENEAFPLPLNNVGAPRFVDASRVDVSNATSTTSDASANVSYAGVKTVTGATTNNTTFNTTSAATSTKIMRTVTAPLLIQLK